MKTADFCQRFGSDIHVKFEGEEKPSVVCEMIRGGLSWPTAADPGYFCILGQYPQVANGKKPLVLLAEGQAELPEDLFGMVAEQARKTMCRDFCAEITFLRGRNDFFDAFNRYTESRGVSIGLAPPDIVDWGNGIVTLRQWAAAGALKDIPRESILARQLGGMTKEAVHDGPRPGFFAVNALRSVIGAFERTPARVREVVRGKDAAGWT